MELTSKQTRKITKACGEILNMANSPSGVLIRDGGELRQSYLHIIYDPQQLYGNFLHEGMLERLHQRLETDLKLRLGVFWVGIHRGDHTFVGLPLELHFWAVVKEGQDD